jgi:formate--tetrahydrofolate ligase
VSGVVIVATIRALKYHGGSDLHELNRENLDAVGKGFANLERHINNVRNHYGLPCVVAVNHFSSDTPAEIDLLKTILARQQVPVVICRHWAEGGKGAEDLARAVLDMVEGAKPQVRYVYDDSASLWDKMRAVATKLYGASDITADARTRAQIRKLQDDGYGHYPICIAKTQYSFSTDPKRRGAPADHQINIREVRLAAGAEFIVLVCGDIMTMPGLPKVPSATKIDVDESGKISGLF